METTLRAAFAAFWGSRTPISVENDAFDPETLFAINAAAPNASNSNAWVRVSLDAVADNVVNQSINQFGTFRRTAVALFEIYIRQGQPIAGANSHVDEVIRFLRRPALLPHAIVTDLAPATVGPNGVWFQRNVTAGLAWFSDQPAI
jgi:hypothetical protein